MDNNIIVPQTGVCHLIKGSYKTGCWVLFCFLSYLFRPTTNTMVLCIMYYVCMYYVLCHYVMIVICAVDMSEILTQLLNVVKVLFTLQIATV